MDLPRTLPDLIGSSQEADLKQEEERYLRDKAAREELEARRRNKNEISLNKLLQLAYGDDAVPPVLQAPKPKSKEDPNGKPAKPVEAFPPPPTRR